MSNLSLGSTYSNARASLVTATGKGGKGSGGGLQGDVNITLPNIAVDVDWNLTKNQGATLAIKNKPTIASGDFYQSTNNPFTKLNGIPTGAKIGYVEAGTLDCDGRLAANNISTNLVDTDKLQATDVASITDPDGKPLFATVAATGQYTDLLSKPALSTVATTGKYTDLSSKPTLSTVAATGNYTDLLSKPTFSTVATSGNYTDLSNAPPQLGDVELQLQTIPTCVDWNLTSNQGSALAVINKPSISSASGSSWTQWQWVMPDGATLLLGSRLADGTYQYPQGVTPLASQWAFRPVSTGSNIMDTTGAITIPATGLYSVSFRVQMQAATPTIYVIIYLQCSDPTATTTFTGSGSLMACNNKYATGRGLVYSESITTALTGGTVLTPRINYYEDTPLGSFGSPAIVLNPTAINIVRLA
jgi:hypothetical protein